MSLLDDARYLAQRGFTPWEDSGALTCEACGEAVEPGEEANTWTGHASDCPWFSLPKIVAALEAAERLVDAFDPDPMRVTTFDNWSRLKRALKGEA